jgi:MOSC domain-containing protein YiiM
VDLKVDLKQRGGTDNMPNIAGEIVAISVGKPQHVSYKGQEIHTAIYKKPITGPVKVSSLNIAGDEQANLEFHGGVDKAINVYSYDRYPYWEEELGKSLEISSFGENLTVKGMREEDVCIGDIYEIGDILVQVSEPRVPCGKLSMRMEEDTMVSRVHANGYSGFYFRVLREGTIGGEDATIRLVERHPKGITLEQANHIRYHDSENKAALQLLLDLKELSSPWHNWLSDRLARL